MRLDQQQDILDQLSIIEKIMCEFCVKCRQDFKDDLINSGDRKKITNYWHDRFSIEAYDALNKIYNILMRYYE